MLSRTETAIPQWTAGRSAGRPVFLQIGQADRDDQKGFEPFPQSDDKRLNHWSSGSPSNRQRTKMRLISFSETIRRCPTSQVGYSE